MTLVTLILIPYLVVLALGVATAAPRIMHLRRQLAGRKRLDAERERLDAEDKSLKAEWKKLQSDKKSNHSGWTRVKSVFSSESREIVDSLDQREHAYYERVDAFNKRLAACKVDEAEVTRFMRERIAPTSSSNGLVRQVIRVDLAIEDLTGIQLWVVVTGVAWLIAVSLMTERLPYVPWGDEANPLLQESLRRIGWFESVQREIMTLSLVPSVVTVTYFLYAGLRHIMTDTRRRQLIANFQAPRLMLILYCVGMFLCSLACFASLTLLLEVWGLLGLKETPAAREISVIQTAGFYIWHTLNAIPLVDGVPEIIGWPAPRGYEYQRVQGLLWAFKVLILAPIGASVWLFIRYPSQSDRQLV
jgi:hypothetical protein